MTETRPATLRNLRRTLPWTLLLLGTLLVGSSFAGATAVGHAPTRGIAPTYDSHALGRSASIAPAAPPVPRAHAASAENASAVGTPNWDNVTGSSGTPPPARSYGRAFAWDPVDHYYVMFGGYGSDGSYLADTWS
ncbi:MAG TPA: hypothetical protein VJQ43_00910, partial [Thermoplasmata archaeon]|nr:hypothetical protein [Thermoplasmata archaeon]